MGGVWDRRSERRTQGRLPGRRGRGGDRTSGRGRAPSGRPPGEPGSAGDGLVLALEAALAVDAIACERQGLEPLLADRLSAALALPEAAFVELLECGHHLAQEPPVAVAQLELELARVGSIGLVAEVFGRVVVETFLVERAAADLGLKLAALGHQRLAQLLQPVLSEL